jgi:hypothetical protein
VLQHNRLSDIFSTLRTSYLTFLYWIISRRRIFGHKREETNAVFIKLNNEDFRNLYYPSSISDKMRLAKHVAHIGQMRSASKFLVGKPEWKRTLGRFRRRWEDNIKMDVKEIRCEDWINAA